MRSERVDAPAVETRASTDMRLQAGMPGGPWISIPYFAAMVVIRSGEGSSTLAGASVSASAG